MHGVRHLSSRAAVAACVVLSLLATGCGSSTTDAVAPVDAIESAAAVPVAVDEAGAAEPAAQVPEPVDDLGAAEPEEERSIDADDAEAVDVPELTGQFQTISGETIDLGSLEGQDVVLWFWAPW